MLTADDCTPRAGFQCAREPASRVPAWTLIGAGVAAGAAGAIVLLTRPSTHTEIGFGPSFVFFREHL